MNGDQSPVFARLELENDDDIVFEVRSAMKAQEEVMATHGKRVIYIYYYIFNILTSYITKHQTNVIFFFLVLHYFITL
jgi:hypothetical protein